MDRTNTSESLAKSFTDLIKSSPQKLSKPCIPVRFVIILLGSFGAAFAFALRVNISVAIVAMVNETAIKGMDVNTSLLPSELELNETVTEMFLLSNGSLATNVSSAILPVPLHKRGTLVWNQAIQGIVLGAYFYGYAAVQPFTGSLTEKYSSVYLCGVGVLLSALLSFATPIAADIHIGVLVLVRLLMGVFHGPILTCLYVMFVKWTAKTERATGISMMVIGANLGSTLGMSLTAYLCEFGFWGGWPSAFYVIGSISLLWCCFWMFYATVTPQEHRYISEYELNYLRQHGDLSDAKKKKSKAPWMAILTSMPVWASLVAKATGAFGYMVINSKLPMYLEDVLNVPIQENGMMNASLYFVVCLTMLFAGPCSDFLYKKQCCSLTVIRKVFQSLSMLGPAICLALVPSVGTDQRLVLTLLIISMLSIGLITGGDMPIIGDIAPDMAGFVFGFTNTVGSSMGFIAPLVVGVLLDRGHGDGKQWDLVFYLSSILMLVGMVFFNIFATAEVQVWGVVSKTDDVETCKAKSGSLSSAHYNENITSFKSFSKDGKNQIHGTSYVYEQDVPKEGDFAR